MTTRASLVAVLSMLLLTACGNATGRPGSGPSSEAPAGGADFPAVFAAVSADVDSRVRTCAGLTGRTVDAWIARLRTAPERAVPALDRYLVRVELAVDRCADGTGADTDVADIGTEADAVRRVLAAGATPPPGASSGGPSSPSATGMVLAGYSVGSACAVAAEADLDSPGVAYWRAVHDAEGPLTGSYQDFQAADAAVRALVPCNAQQAAYRQNQLDLIGWYAASGACTPLHDNATTIEDVDVWLACVAPVNEGLLLLNGQSGDLEKVVFDAPCTAGYAPPTPHGSPGFAWGRAVNVASAIGDAVSLAKDVKDLGELLRDGVKLVGPGELGPDGVNDYLTKIRVTLGPEARDAAVDAVRGKLDVITLPPDPATLPHGDVPVSASVTVSGADLTPATFEDHTTVAGG